MFCHSHTHGIINDEIAVKRIHATRCGTDADIKAALLGHNSRLTITNCISVINKQFLYDRRNKKLFAARFAESNIEICKNMSPVCCRLSSFLAYHVYCSLQYTW